MAVTLRRRHREAPDHTVPRGDGRWGLPSLRDFIVQLRASWVNKKWISPEQLDEIRRGN